MDSASPTAATSTAAPYDVLIIGAGAAGMLAALGARAEEAGLGAGGSSRLLILEKMAKAGRKISASGGGRCNFSNTLNARQFVDRFGHGGKFLGAALKAFPNQALIDMLAKHGVTGEVEQGYRLYTTSGRGEDVTDAILDELATAKVPLLTGRPVQQVAWQNGFFEVTVGRDAADRPAAGAAGLAETERLSAKTLIIAVGGASYPKLGSTGDGYTWAKQFGHTVTPLQAALVGVHVEELALCQELQGLRMDSCVARLVRGKQGGKPLASEPGDLLFAHFGVTGPALLDLSLAVVAELARTSESEPLYLSLDLAPDITAEKLRARLDETLKDLGAADRGHAFEARLPKRLRQVLWRVADPATAAEAAAAQAAEATNPADVLARVRSGVGGNRDYGRATQAEHPASRTPAAVRDRFIRAIKDWRFTITGTRELEVGEVTDGGVALNEVDKQTMMSKKQPGLFFCGEILDLTGRCGGFNLQAAWSTGYLAGKSALKFARAQS
ncbi:MAG TPA: aminoacetone oxidase family FAD-binding enzyme [Planctomycetota bacterium]|nr:aminoacetone oxidase family FAD-binding enzyme [Planctomycetota bacterium]